MGLSSKRNQQDQQQEYLTPKEVSQMLKVSVKLLANWRVKGCGPSYIKLGQGVKAPIRYPLTGDAGLIGYLDSARKTSTSN